MGDRGRRQHCAAAPSARGQAASLARKPARPRLVHLLSRRRADRLRSLHRGLSDHAKMDAGRRSAWCSRSAASSGCSDRCRAAPSSMPRAPNGWSRVLRSRPSAAARWPMRCADLSGGGGGRDAACARELRAGSGDCRDQPRPGRAACDRRTARAQCPLCLARQRRRRGRDGRVRLSAVQPLGVPGHLPSRDPDLAGAGAHPRAARSTSRVPMARCCARRPIRRPPACSVSCASARC